MSAQKPATPLPWRHFLQGDSTRFLVAEQRSPNGRIAAQVPQQLGDGARNDAAYIAHAANAYPRLVEALRALEQACYVYGQGSQVPDLPVLKQAGALLRELGEVAS
jgi:hypothetical protein